jgi:hypothetical protein
MDKQAPTVQPPVADAAQRQRAAYQKPRLTRYGSLADITRAVGENGLMDGGAETGKMSTRP